MKENDPTSLYAEYSYSTELCAANGAVYNAGTKNEVLNIYENDEKQKSKTQLNRHPLFQAQYKYHTESPIYTSSSFQFMITDIQLVASIADC